MCRSFCLVVAASLLLSVGLTSQEPSEKKPLSISVRMVIPPAGCDNGQPVLTAAFAPGRGPTPRCLYPTAPKVSYSSPIPETWASTEVGTVIVVGFSQKQIIVAADSRSGIRSSEPPFFRIDDSRCKVVDLDRRLIFAAAGQTRVLPSSGPAGIDLNLPGGLYYDSQEFAKYSASTFKVDPAWMAPNETVLGIAQSWAWNVAFRIRHAVEASLYPATPGATAVVGVFAGREPNGDLSLAIAHLNYERPRTGLIVPVVSLYIEVPEVPATFTWVQAFGREEVANNYLMTQKITDRTRPMYRRITTAQAAAPATFPADLLQELAVLTAKEDTARFPDGSSFVGGATDIAKLPRTGDVQWLNRKAACK